MSKAIRYCSGFQIMGLELKVRVKKDFSTFSADYTTVMLLMVAVSVWPIVRK